MVIRYESNFSYARCGSATDRSKHTSILLQLFKLIGRLSVNCSHLVTNCLISFASSKFNFILPPNWFSQIWLIVNT